MFFGGGGVVEQVGGGLLSIGSNRSSFQLNYFSLANVLAKVNSIYVSSIYGHFSDLNCKWSFRKSLILSNFLLIIELLWATASYAGKVLELLEICQIVSPMTLLYSRSALILPGGSPPLPCP